MANTCKFLCHVSGRREDVEEFKRLLWDNSEDGFQGIYKTEENDIIEREKDGIVTSIIPGFCKWNLSYCLFSTNHANLDEVTGKLSLKAEFYGAETGIGFQEHIHCEDGCVLENATEDYEEVYVEHEDVICFHEMCDKNSGKDRKEVFEEWREKFSYPPEVTLDGIDNGDNAFGVGGFQWEFSF